ncbi:MAG: hypothetical protein KGO03_00095 [Gemmatimonadota bacterium]|nr:hypothetical protein [Gemmatimonadota bacterium]MDE3214761.1 hypothetical protein [Gemmatimonadota bacterium]
MPAYDLATVAFAVDAPRKWVDNTCSHFAITGVESTQRGVSRQFSFDGVLAVQLVRNLCVEMGLPVHAAVRLATAMLADPDAAASFARGVVISLDLETLTHHVQQRLLEAVESVPRIRRGRPPSRSGDKGGA